MQSLSSEGAEDPLIAALPPATDYLTYLTLLEYQLTAENLPTLNHLLLADDGTLAAEIGWDLLQLVLPILRVQPQPADECLQIIARRGNPREVIVRLAEELERLAQDGYDNDDEEPGDAHGLPTFAGEAPRVHLGDMKLDGMSDREEDVPANHGEDADEEVDAVNSEFDNLKFLSLVNLLPILQSRIKTQYPSRFLATSLPAVLGAFRRMGAKPNAADAILEALKSLSGKQRPALPPRASTTGTTAALPQIGVPVKGVTQVSEPDPEAKSNDENLSNEPAAGEKAIIQRLLQAVLLEVLEDYSATYPEPLLCLQTRLKVDKESLPTHRMEGLEATLAQPAVQLRLKLLSKFVRVSRELNLDVDTEARRLAQSDSSAVQTEEPEDEYPTSPSQIPFSTTGLVILIAMTQSATAIPSELTTSEKLAPSQILSLVTYAANTFPLLLASPSTIDALLAILYTTLFTSPDQKPPSTISHEILHRTYNTLTTIYTTCPHIILRDSAAQLAARLFHAYIPNTLKTTVIRETLYEKPLRSRTAAPREVIVGNVKAVAVGLLKDSVFPNTSIKNLQQQNPGLSVNALEELSDLLFPSIPTAPETLDEEAKTQYEVRGGQYINVVGEVVAHLPFYIAVLNLVDLLGSQHLVSEGEGDGNKTEAETLPKVLASARGFQEGLDKWRKVFSKSIPDKGAESEEDLVSVTDVFALEDALERAARWVEASGPEND